MRRIRWIIWVLMAMIGCAASGAAVARERPVESGASGALQLTSVVADVADHMQQPVSAPQASLFSNKQAEFDVDAQAAALLPEFQGDLERADEWNRYTIDVAIDPQARTIAGRMRLEYNNRDSAPLDALYFRLYPNLQDRGAFGGRLDVSAITVDGRSIVTAYEQRRSVLRVDLPQHLEPGSGVVVELDFSAKTPENASARFYGAFNKERGVFALASSYPIVAIVRDGVWDTGYPDPKGDFVNSETSLYDVTLTAPADWTLVTSGVEIDGWAREGRQARRFVSGPQRDFMIVATQYARVSAEVDGTQVHSYFRPGGAAGGQAALDAGVNALRAFNERYGRYPLVELDIVEFAATTFLGVEYPGLLMIERTLYNQPANLEITVAHEVAHQWWYSLVGSDVQHEAWIDEGLASFSQVVYQEEVYGSAVAARELEGFRQRYRAAIAQGRDAQLAQHNARFRGNYVNLVYGKSVLFFQALREQIGEAAFDRFLRDLYAERRYDFVSGVDVLASAESACTCELDGLYREWVLSVGR